MKAYFRLFFAFVALGLLAAALVGVVYVWENVIQPDRVTNAEIEEIQKRKKKAVDHGQKVYEDAVTLMRTGNLDAGVRKLHELMVHYDDSSFLPEAKRIVGEINVDRLLSKAPMPGKSEYIVKSGDALSRIANAAKSTIGYIIHVNGRMGSALQKGDQLIVCPLEFEILVKLSAKTITLRTADDKFFKEYALVDYKRPTNTPWEIDTQVSLLVVATASRRIAVGTPEYISSPKELRCARAGMALRAKTGDAEKDKYTTGIFLAPEDIEELALLFRPGSWVYVRK